MTLLSKPRPIRRRTPLCPLPFLIACAAMTTSCASFGPPSAPPAPASPQLALPAEARDPCRLARGDYLSIEDLELLHRQRGRDLVECDSRRELAVSAHDREHQLEAEHARRRAERTRPRWMKLTPWRER